MDHRRLMEALETSIKASEPSCETLRSAVLSIAKELTQRDSLLNQKRERALKQLKLGAWVCKTRGRHQFLGPGS
ncbi:hypothetical protein DLNHIDIE_00182 [Acidithiobacillus thiooxidans ATCC 19377]|uniref:Uncharacterized protein n=1 Tax=Acidithiobacillus thiooxidans ATCC 19377 TaxID=637390 RepID=A0A543Q1V9_ACITH|nr:hypothetical protein DLNHIDIE_00182 [Acidithiobacillus thiooxidans ATCC 19377]